MDKIKVLWVANALGYGGAEKQLLYMYDILKNSPQYDITVLYYAHMKDELNLDGVKTVYIDKKTIGPIKTIRQIRKYIKENDIKIVHALGGSSANVYGRFGAALRKGVVPIGAMLGKKHFVSWKMKLVNSLLNMFGNWWTVNNLDLIPILKKDLCFVNDKKIVMVHNGFVPADKVNYHKNEETEYDLAKGEDFVFGVVGRVEPVKNYPLFLRAAKEVLSEFPHTKFWVIGNGKSYDDLVALAKELEIDDSVKFWGFRDDVDAALARMDVFVQTSFTEGSPNTVAEAMRASLPVITTNSTDFSEMIIDGKNGYVTESDNLDQLVSAMKKMLSLSKDELKACGRVSNELFMNTFLDSKVKDEYKMLYEKVLIGGKKDA